MESPMSIISKLISALRTALTPFATANRVNSGAGPYGEGNPSGWYH
jgi:hypothetical protein